jgi:hypothetical protein
MIPAIQIVDRIEAALDAEGFERYTWDRDYCPAINYAQEWVTSVFSSALGSNKFNEEALQDLTYSRVWKTNMYSRFVFQPGNVGQNLWTIIGIYPECVVTPLTDIVQPDLTKSVYSSIHSYVSGYYSAGRVTAEEMNMNRRNPFHTGNEIVTCAELKTYAYKTTTNYRGGYIPSSSVSDVEIEIFPSYKNSILCMEYLKYPTPIVEDTDSVEYPLAIINMIVEKALYFISTKQAGVPLQQSSDAEMNKLITLMS